MGLISSHEILLLDALTPDFSLGGVNEEESLGVLTPTLHTLNSDSTIT